MRFAVAGELAYTVFEVALVFRRSLGPTRSTGRVSVRKPAAGSGARRYGLRAMDGSTVGQWFAVHPHAFAACGRGERDTASMLAYYGVPLMLTTDDGFFALTSDDQVVAALQPQVDGMRAGGYHRSEILSSEVTVLNSNSALYRGTFSRQKNDGGGDQPAHRDVCSDRWGGQPPDLSARGP